MGIRYFCDRCEKEFKSNGLAIEIWVRDALGVKIAMGKGLLCEECAKKFNMVKDRLDCEEDFFTMKDDEIDKILTPTIPTSDSFVIGFDNSATDSACLAVSRNDGKHIKTINTFYGEDALKEYKKLIGIK